MTSEKATEQSQPLSKSPSNKKGLTFPETMEALGKQFWEDHKDIETKEQGLSKSPRNKQGLNITETVEKVNQQRMQNLMDIEAKELVGFFKVHVLQIILYVRFLCYAMFQDIYIPFHCIF